MTRPSETLTESFAFNDRAELATLPGYVVTIIGATNDRCPCPDPSWHPEFIVKDASGDYDYVCSLLARKVT